MKKLLILMLFVAPLASAQTARWLTVYWGNWNNGGDPSYLPIRSVGTHWIYFSLGVGWRTDSTVFDHAGIAAYWGGRARQFSDSCHAAGKKSIIGLGTSGFQDMWMEPSNAAISPRRITKSLNDIEWVCNYGGFDGIDIDWEMGNWDDWATNSGNPGNIRMMQGFSDWLDSLRARHPSPFLVFSCSGVYAWTAARYTRFDQVNAMVYDQAGSWFAQSWHNSAATNIAQLKNGNVSSGYVLPSNHDVVAVGAYANGWNTSQKIAKLGIAMESFGYVWSGCTAPFQSFSSVDGNWATNSYRQLMEKYSGYGVAWDDNAKTAFISAPGKFVSCDFDTGIVYKGRTLVPDLGVGGAIYYEAGTAYRPDQADPWSILKWCEYAFRNGPRPAKDSVPPPPVVAKTNMTIYDDRLASPFAWANDGTFDGANTEHVFSGAYAAKITMGGWGSMIIIGGGADYYIDSLSFDLYCAGSNLLGVNYWAGSQPPNWTPPAGAWTHYVLPGPGPGVAFNKFMIGNASGNTLQPMWVDNIKFVSTSSGKTDVGDQLRPLDFALEQNYPNPFNPATTIEFSVPNRTLASLKVFDILGAEVATLLNDVVDPGKHRVAFDASTSGNGRRPLSSGVYFYRLTTEKYTETRRLVLMK